MWLATSSIRWTSLSRSIYRSEMCGNAACSNQMHRGGSIPYVALDMTVSADTEDWVDPRSGGMVYGRCVPTLCGLFREVLWRAERGRECIRTPVSWR